MQIAIEDVNVFIARDGSVIGEYPHTEITAMVRAGQLLPDDHYWHEGMEDWILLPEFVDHDAWEPEAAPPPEPPPPNRPLILGSLAASIILATLVGFLFIKPYLSRERLTTTSRPPRDAAEVLRARDRATADLGRRIERLPSTPTPPLNIFYYDVNLNIKTTFLPRSPWSATIHGAENLVDPATGKTLSRTDFVLTTDYEDGEWIYKRYLATVSNLSEGTSINVMEDGSGPTPPSIVGMLALKRREPTRISKVPGFK